jgi:hypothetical protein
METEPLKQYKTIYSVYRKQINRDGTVLSTVKIAEFYKDFYAECYVINLNVTLHTQKIKDVIYCNKEQITI